MNSSLKRPILWFFFGMLLVHGLVFWNSRNLIRSGYPDFTSFYAAGKIVHDGLGSQLYDLATQWKVQQTFAAGVDIRRGPLPYFHPPFEALLFAPLAHHSYLAAYLIWNAFNVAILFGVAWLLRVHLRGLQRLPIWLQLLLPFSLSPVILTLLQGQDSLWLLLFYSLAYLALKKNADFRAGCWLALGLFKPQLVLPFVLILMLQRNRLVLNRLVRSKVRFISGFLALAGVLGLICAAVVGWPELLRYPVSIWSLEQTGLVLSRDIPNLRGIGAGLLSHWLPENPTLLLLAIFSVVVILLAARKPERVDADSWDLIFCYSLLATILVSYHVFAQDLSILLLPFFLILNGLLEDLPRQGYRMMVATALLLFGLVFPLQQFHSVNLLALVLLAWMWAISREMARVSPGLTHES